MHRHGKRSEDPQHHQTVDGFDKNHTFSFSRRNFASILHKNRMIANFVFQFKLLLNVDRSLSDRLLLQL